MKKVQDKDVQKPVNIKPEANNVNKRGNLINVGNELDDINSSFVGKREEKVVNEETTNKNNKKLIIIGAVAVVLLIIILGVNVYKKINADTTLNFKLVDVNEYKDTDEVNTETDKDNIENIGLDVVEQSDINNPAELNKYHKVSTIVNTKLQGTESYKDYESAYYFGLTSILSGYDEVIGYINEYNKTGQKIVEIPGKEEFEEQYKGMTLVMLEVELKYPSDYPTNLGENKVYKVPNFNLSITGTYKDETDTDYSNMIVIDNATFSISESISITDKPKEININDTVKFRYILIMPVGTDGEGYVINVSCDENKSVYKGYDITHSPS